MLEFQELTVKEGARLRPYYETCDYRLCEYSLGVKLMWRDYLHPWFTEAAGCLIIRNCIEGQYVFDYPILGPEGDAGAALAAIEQYCGDKELPLVLSVVPEDKASQLVLRYPPRHRHQRAAVEGLPLPHRGSGPVCRTAVQRPAQPHQ